MCLNYYLYSSYLFFLSCFSLNLACMTGVWIHQTNMRMCQYHHYLKVLHSGVSANIYIFLILLQFTSSRLLVYLTFPCPPGVFLGYSSNTRYQIINGLERVVEASPMSKRFPAIAMAFTVGARFSNNIYGGMQFVDWARLSGCQWGIFCFVLSMFLQTPLIISLINLKPNLGNFM